MMLVDVTPYTPAPRIEPGLVHIMDESLAAGWVEAHAAELLADGYASCTVTPHRAGGRQWRWFSENDAARVKEEMR